MNVLSGEQMRLSSVLGQALSCIGDCCGAVMRTFLKLRTRRICVFDGPPECRALHHRPSAATLNRCIHPGSIRLNRLQPGLDAES